MTPPDVDGLCQSARADIQAGAWPSAARRLHAALLCEPGSADAWQLLAVVRHYRSADHDGACVLIGRAIRIAPQLSALHNNLGNFHQAAGRLAGARDSFALAIGLGPPVADLYFNRGNALRDLDGPAAALTSYRQALILQPSHAGTLNNLGRALRPFDRVGEAEWLLLRAARLRPAWEDPLFNLAGLRRQQFRLGDAARLLRAGLCINPAAFACWGNLSTVRFERGEVAAAMDDLRRAVRIDPDEPVAAANLTFMELYHPPTARLERIKASADRWASRQRPSRRYHHDGDPAQAGRRPLLGLVSADFRHHAVATLLLPSVEELARRGWEIVCYHCVDGADAMTERFRRAAAVWHDIERIGDDDAAALIRADGVDLLFDLGGHSTGNRLPIFARRPAPVQISWLGYPATTGLAEIDYILADRHQVPPGADRHYSEAVIRLPHFYVAPTLPALAKAPPLPALRGRHVTFGSFNGVKKIGDPVVDLWSRLLHRLPGSRLLLKALYLEDPWVAERLVAAFVRNGIGAERLVLAGGSGAEQHRAAMAEVDLALDPFPYSGGVTTLELLSMGLPVVTLPGDSFASRHSAGYLSAIGLDDWVAGSEAAYLDIACAAAANLPRLSALRDSLPRMVAASPLGDVAGFVDTLEMVLRRVWQSHCAGLPSAIRPCDAIL